jgi:hypothetical protein
MDPRSCAECLAIARDLREASRAGRPAESGLLTAWVRSLDEEECTRMRESSPMWRTWRRREVHRALTGHVVPLAVGFEGLSSN